MHVFNNYLVSKLPFLGAMWLICLLHFSKWAFGFWTPATWCGHSTLLCASLFMFWADTVRKILVSPSLPSVFGLQHCFPLCYYAFWMQGKLHEPKISSICIMSNYMADNWIITSSFSHTSMLHYASTAKPCPSAAHLEKVSLKCLWFDRRLGSCMAPIASAPKIPFFPRQISPLLACDIMTRGDWVMWGGGSCKDMINMSANSLTQTESFILYQLYSCFKVDIL